MLSWEYPPYIVGGLGRHVADIAPALAAQGMDVHVVTPNIRHAPAVEEVMPGLTIHRASVPEPAHDLSSLVLSTKLSNNCLQETALKLHEEVNGFHIIHAHDWSVAYSSVALKHVLKLPLLVTIHSTEYGRMLGHLVSEESREIHGIEEWLACEASRVITVSKYMAQQIRSIFNVPEDKIDTIVNGVTMPADPPMAGDERANFRQQYAEPDEKIVYYVGRVVHEKGLHILVDAAPRILEKFPRLQFIVAGVGPYLDTVKERAREQGVATHFNFVGFIADDVRDKLYQVADVAVFPSLYEPFGIVALEAIAHECPVVVSATGGLAEVVRSHETGIVTQPDDPESLAWGILHTLQYPQWAAARASNAQHELEVIYNWNRIASRTIDIYRRTYNAWLESPWSHR
jgi:glycogen(starch) synthase